MDQDRSAGSSLLGKENTEEEGAKKSEDCPHTCI